MKPIIFTSLLVIYLLGSSCAPRQSFDTHLNSIIKPYLFSIARWESQALPDEIKQWLLSRQEKQEKIDAGTVAVTEYFSLAERIRTLQSAITANASQGGSNPTSLETELKRLQASRAVLVSTVERILEKQIRDTLAEQGIYNPLIESKVSFPPLNFKLDQLPYLLVISPREKIESIREKTLKPSLVLEEKTDIEARVDKLDVSSLVVEIGGLGATYPTLVSNDAGLRSTIDAIVEEWLHQYLAFKPLGFLYLLDLTGISRNYEIATMNESTASMVSKEIGSIVYNKYYPEYNNSVSQSQTTEKESDFNREMRETRRTVDILLARGEIKQAEEFMEQKRQYLASIGYHIRKLNQAYFAFHGTYADMPTSISPIGVELRKLREQSTSLKDFLNRVAAMTNRQELADSIK
ncbi:MAG: hypothetical protein HYU83_02395 [Chloroflexi bacterium]|nr:hypothetical protein [Chloroflexota bacterium]